MKVAMRPAWSVGNTYPSLLAEALSQEGMEVADMPQLRRFPVYADCIILHWPDEFFVRRTLKIGSYAVALAGLMAASKLISGQKLVWVVHNVAPHDHEQTQEWQLKRVFFRFLDGLIFLSNASRDLLLKRYPELAAKPYVVARHGHYKDGAIRPASASQALEGRPSRLGFVGNIRRYKCPAALARMISELPAGTAELRISGHCSDMHLREELAGVAARSSAVTVDFGFLSDAELEQHVDWADGVVQPYRDILNSGSVLYALSRSRPVLAPRLGSLQELQEDVGPEWLHLYEGAFSRPILESFLESLRSGSRSADPDLSRYDWSDVGRDIASFLRSL